MSRSINKILIANRGEIAIRVMRTARRMGIRTVAIYSEADAHALHVKMADEAYCVGAAAPQQSYLNIDAILAVAQKTGADAIHPGYGFLSENARFAAACTAAGVVFIGPPASAIEAMGSKSAAKALMVRANVPVVPGYHDEDQSLDVLTRHANQIGYPVLIKAAAGGGGKGMKVVRAEAEFAMAVESAKREAKKAFGDDRVLIEKYLTAPRHIEVQVFADQHGNFVYLFERDCSIQRRHQKVIEEAPAPGMSAERRALMGKTAVEAAKAVGYVGAGTIEFIAEGDHFYFMEMNTRLQVEHPVTEKITGQDLVEWQIRVARGETLPKMQDQLSIHGHAVEVRLYAEDPQRDFLPQTGRLTQLQLPGDMPNIRVDSGVEQGDEISIHYDPMIAKIIAYGDNREQAMSRLSAALQATRCVGLMTNLTFLRKLVTHPGFAAGQFDTGYIAKHSDSLQVSAAAPLSEWFAIAGVALLATEQQRVAVDRADPYSPWTRPTGWRSNRAPSIEWLLACGGEPVSVKVHVESSTVRVDVGATTHVVRFQHVEEGVLDTWMDGTFRRVQVDVQKQTVRLLIAGDDVEFTVTDPFAAKRAADDNQARVVSPMPGLITRILVTQGQKVRKGEGLVVVEAMKMEHTLTAPRDAVIKEIKYRANEQVTEGVELVEFEDEGTAT